MPTQTGGGTDAAGVTDSLVVELNGVQVAGVKGPDPEVWGEGQTLPAPLAEGQEVKGPDPEQWGNGGDT